MVVTDGKRRIVKPGQVRGEPPPGAGSRGGDAEVRVVETFAVGHGRKNIELPAKVVDEYADATSETVLGMSQVVHDVSDTAGAAARRTTIDSMLITTEDVDISARPAIGRSPQVTLSPEGPALVEEESRVPTPSPAETEVEVPDEAWREAEAARRSAQERKRRAAAARRKKDKLDREARKAEAQRQEAAERAAEAERQEAAERAAARKREAAARRRQEEREQVEAAIRAGRQLRRIPFDLVPGEEIEAAGLNDPQRRRPWLTTHRFVISAPGARTRSWELEGEDAPVIRRTGLPKGCVQVRVGDEKFILAPCSLKPASERPVAPPAPPRVQELPPPVPHPPEAESDHQTSFTARPNQESPSTAIWAAAVVAILVIVMIAVVLAG